MKRRKFLTIPLLAPAAILVAQEPVRTRPNKGFKVAKNNGITRI